MIDALLALYRAYPLLGMIVETGLVLLVTTLIGRGVLSILRRTSTRLAAGPVLLLSALIVGAAFAITLGYLAVTGRSFETAAIEWLSGVKGESFEQLGSMRYPFVLGLTYAALYGVFCSVALLLAWFLGLLKGDGGAAREVEAELGTSLAERFYKLAGFREPGVQETRFSEWGRPLVRALRIVQWIALGGAVTGSLSPPLWALGAILIEGVSLNLVDPPKSPEEERRRKEKSEEIQTQYKDADQLVRALSTDPRGPELDVRAGGTVSGQLEHVAERTRLGDESTLMQAALQTLGITGFYVHQEAAAEGILSGKNILMETPPLSGRRTLGDLLAMRAVLLQGGSVLYLSPDADESARRARAFRDLSATCNWAWALHSHDLANHGRRGVHPQKRPPAIVFSTPTEVHEDICPRHAEWDGFLSRLSLIVAVDLDRYGGVRGSSLAFTMRRLMRLVRKTGARPVVLSTIAPFGPDVLGLSERLMGVPFDVIGPESDSRGAPPQQIVVGTQRAAGELHPAVGARGVAIACGYRAELFGFDETLTTFEQEQQVNRVLLDFGHAVIQTGDGGHLKLDAADAVVSRLRPENAALLRFFTRHAGRTAIDMATLSAREVRARSQAPDGSESRFGGFDVDEEKKQPAPAPADSESNDADDGDASDATPDQGPADEPSVEIRADRVVSIWLPEEDPFSRLLSEHPEYLDPRRLHPMLGLGSAPVAATDLPQMAARHAVLAAAESPLAVSEAHKIFPACSELLGDPSALGLRQRTIATLSPGGGLEREVLLTHTDAEESASTTALTASGDVGRLLDRGDGAVLWSTDKRRLRSAAYPGRVLMAGGRRYRVLLPEEQPGRDQGDLYAVPERRRTVTAPIRRLEFSFAGVGHELNFGGPEKVRLHHPMVELKETVLGVRSAHAARGSVDELFYATPEVILQHTRVAVVQLPAAAPEAVHGVAHLARATLRAFLQHREEDLDVAWNGTDSQIYFVDRHGEAGFARALTSSVLQHTLFWAFEILRSARHDPDCGARNGCSACVFGIACHSHGDHPGPSRSAAEALLGQILGSHASLAPYAQ